MDTWTQGHRGTGAQGHRGTGAQGHGDTHAQAQAPCIALHQPELQLSVAFSCVRSGSFPGCLRMQFKIVTPERDVLQVEQPIDKTNEELQGKLPATQWAVLHDISANNPRYHTCITLDIKPSPWDRYRLHLDHGLSVPQSPIIPNIGRRISATFVMDEVVTQTA